MPDAAWSLRRFTAEPWLAPTTIVEPRGNRYPILRLADCPHLRGSSAFLDHREVPADASLADIEWVSFAGIPIGSRVGLVKGAIELGMIRHEGGRAEIGGRLRHLPH